MYKHMALEKSRELARLREKLGIDILWVYVLSLLEKKESHAYALRSEIEKKFGFLPGNVTVYVVLYKLKKRGFVRAEKDVNRVVYSITSKGKELLKAAEKEFGKRKILLF